MSLLLQRVSCDSKTVDAGLLELLFLSFSLIGEPQLSFF
jgi:hypothetical protein